MSWIYLLVAAMLEIAWAVGLKYTEGFTRFWPTVITVVLMIGSFFALAQAVNPKTSTIPIGTGYAIWTGIGAIGTAILGIILFAESASLPRLGCLALVILGIVGLKYFGGENKPALPAPPARLSEASQKRLNPTQPE
ncbi:MAG: multidrug efflux SMR transporter [Pirellulaceae bacterium]